MNRREAVQWTSEEGVVLMTDLVQSTKMVERLTDDDLMSSFFNGPYRRYEEQLVAALQGWYEKGELQRIRTTGDGFAVTLRNPALALELAVRLQEICDDFASRLLEEGFEEPELEARRDGFHFDTRIGLATGRLVSRSMAHEPGFSGSLDPETKLREFTGPGFHRAARIADKARPWRAVLSPLFDDSLLEKIPESERDELRIFFTGQYTMDHKGGMETPLGRPGGGKHPHDVKLYSAVPRGSPLEPLADRFDSSLQAHYDRRRGDALDGFRQLARELARSREEELGPVVTKRWREVVRHFSYAVVNLGGSP
jgi:class 3 adenylate cyclase